MALSLIPFTSFTQTVTTAGTAVVLSTAIPDNCHTIVFKNPSVADTIYIAWQSSTAAITAANGLVLGPSQTFTYAIGPRSTRPSSGSTETLYFDASANGAQVYITYINSLSG